MSFQLQLRHTNFPGVFSAVVNNTVFIAVRTIFPVFNFFASGNIFFWQNSVFFFGEDQEIAVYDIPERPERSGLKMAICFPEFELF